MQYIPENFKQELNNELKDREHVAWSTRPNSFYSILSATPAFLFGIPWNAFLLFMHDKQLGKNESIYLDVFVLPFYLVGLYLFLTPVIEWRKARKTLYVITNLRAFSLKLGQSVIVESFYPKSIGNIEKTVRSNGSGNLILARDHHIDSDGDKKVTDYGFFALPNVIEAEKQLDKLLEQ